MRYANDESDQPKQLTADELVEVRNALSCCVPLRWLARQHGLTETELQVQLGQPAEIPTEEPKHISHVLDEFRRQRFGGPSDGR